MSDLQKVSFDGVDHYLSSEVDEKVSDLDLEIENLEGELSNAQEEAADILCDYHNQGDYEDECKSLKSWLKIAADTMRGLDQSVEVVLDGKITDLAGFISDIEWEIKA